MNEQLQFEIEQGAWSAMPFPTKRDILRFIELGEAPEEIVRRFQNEAAIAGFMLGAVYSAACYAQRILRGEAPPLDYGLLVEKKK